MKRTTLRGLVVIQFLLAANAGLLCAQSNFATEGVTCRTNLGGVSVPVAQAHVWNSEITSPGAPLLR